jgi:hypothetical protein
MRCYIRDPQIKQNQIPSEKLFHVHNVVTENIMRRNTIHQTPQRKTHNDWYTKIQ